MIYLAAIVALQFFAILVLTIKLHRVSNDVATLRDTVPAKPYTHPISVRSDGIEFK